eukprot:Sspe_Gene.53508::Locus_29563_Transcript_1_1_Confidence_1.000_Length_686::g.53508::m.53508
MCRQATVRCCASRAAGRTPAATTGSHGAVLTGAVIGGWKAGRGEKGAMAERTAVAAMDEETGTAAEAVNDATAALKSVSCQGAASGTVVVTQIPTSVIFARIGAVTREMAAA